VEVSSSSMGGLVDDRTIQDLPLNAAAMTSWHYSKPVWCPTVAAPAATFL
jgi:hypothetical protein